MKKTGIIAGLVATWCTIAACGGAPSDQLSKDSTAGANQTAVVQNSNAAQDTTGSIGTETKGSGGTSRAVELLAGSDCLSCHKVRDKLIGPSYEEIAKKYTSKDTDSLVSKIIKGGSGNFGTVPMTPHPTLSKADAEEMVKYILSIK